MSARRPTDMELFVYVCATLAGLMLAFLAASCLDSVACERDLYDACSLDGVR